MGQITFYIPPGREKDQEKEDTMKHIKWIHKGKVIEGISTYPDLQSAEKQASIWGRLFPMNKYFIY